MSFEEILGGIVRQYIRLSKTEAKVLDTLIAMKSGNAYSLWKKSGLKHYPTVLRTLKKLEEKSLAQALRERGARGERICVPTSIGTIVSYIFNEEEKKIVKMVAKNSSLFRELSKINKGDDLALFAVQDIVFDVYRKKEPRSINEAIKERLEEDLNDHLLNILDERSLEWIIKVSKVKSIRELVVKEIEHQIDWGEKQVEALKRLKKTLKQSSP